jgi:hypothetical protein
MADEFCWYKINGKSSKKYAKKEQNKAFRRKNKMSLEKAPWKPNTWMWI